MRRVFASAISAAVAPIVNRILRKSGTPARQRRISAAFEPLESRQLLTVLSATTATDYYIRSDADHANTQVWVNADPATDAPTHTYDRLDLESLIINGSADDDSLTLDFSNGAPLRSNALTFNGDEGNDTVTILGRATDKGSYTPTGQSSGTLITARKPHSFTGVDSVKADTFLSFNLIAPADAENLTLDTPTTNVGRIAESSGSTNTAFVPLLVTNVKKTTVDAAANDANDAADTLTIASTGFAPSGIGVETPSTLIPLTGTGDDTLAVTGGTTNLNATMAGGYLAVTTSNSATLNLTSTQYLHTLVLNDSSQVNMPKVATATSTTSASPFKILFLDGLLIPGSAAKLDVADNDMVIHNGSIDDVLALVQSAYGSSTPHWQGPGITSSTAALDPNKTGIGFVRASDDPNRTAFDGQEITGTDVLIKFAYRGDANLDAEVSISDYIDAAANMNQGGGKYWRQGDFNYDTIVTSSDVGSTISNFGDGGSASHPAKPQLSVAGGDSADEGDTYTLDLTTSITRTYETDCEDPDTGEPYTCTQTQYFDPLSSWTIYWGDGESEVIPAAITTPSSAATATIHPTHVYADDSGSTFSISAFAKGARSNFFAGSKAVTIDNLDPTLGIAGNTTVDEGALYTLNLSSSDAGEDQVSAWLIEWGDGTFDEVSGDQARATHAFKGIEAQYTIHATAYDEDSSFDADPLTVTIGNVAPTATISGANSAAEGAAYTLNLSATDPGQDPISKWIINWGDGPAETVYGNPEATDHVYKDNSGTPYTITASAYDRDGASSTPASQSVTVTNIAPVLTGSYIMNYGQTSRYKLSLQHTDPGDDDLVWHIHWDNINPAEDVTEDGDVFHTYSAGDSPALTITASDEDGTYSVSPSNGTHQSASQILYQVHIERINTDYPAGTVVEGDLGINRILDTDNPSDRMTDGFIVSAANPLQALQSSISGAVHVIPVDRDPYDATFPADYPQLFHIAGPTWSPSAYQHEAIITVGDDDAGWAVEIKPLRVWMNAQDPDFASETPDANHTPGFYIYRNMDLPQWAPQQRIYLNKSGDLSTSEHGVPDFVDIPEGESEVFVPLDIDDDEAPEWTENLDVELADNQPFMYDQENSEFNFEITDNDIFMDLDADSDSEGNESMIVNDDDDDENGIYDLDETNANSDDDLYALHLDFPPASGGHVTLSMGTVPYAAKVWDSANKGKLLLGEGIFEAPLSDKNDTVYVEGIAPTELDHPLFLVLAAAQPATTQITRPTTTQATTRPITREGADDTDVAIEPREAIVRSFDAITEFEFHTQWKLLHSKKDTKGQIVQHVTATRTSRICGDVTLTPKVENLVGDDGYWEAWTVDEGQIWVKSREDNTWGLSDFDKFAANGTSAIHGTYGTLVIKGVYRYTKDALVPAERQNGASLDLFSTNTKPNGWKDADGHSNHIAEYSWNDCPEAGKKEPRGANKLVVTPTMDVTRHGGVAL